MRFPEFNHETHERHEKDKGELPVGWKACKLGACFKERKETNPDLPLLAITSDRGVIPIGITRELICIAGTSERQKNHFLFFKIENGASVF